MSTKPRLAMLAGIAAFALLVVAALRFDRSARSSGAAPTPELTLRDSPFPRAVVDAQGNTLRIPQRPSAIASQALVTDHFLFEVLSPDRMVAVSFPADDPRFSFVADIVRGMDVAVSSNAEEVVRRSPDLMLVSHTARADFVDLMRAVGIPVFRIRTIAEHFGQIEEGLRMVGHVTGQDAEAERAIRHMRERLDRARARRPARAPSPRVLVFADGAYTLGRGSLMDHILTELGAVNVAAEHGVGPYGTISSEEVAAWDPEWIVIPAVPGSEAGRRSRLLTDAGVAVTVAGRREQVIVLDNRTYLSMSHHAAGIMETIAAALYPEDP